MFSNNSDNEAKNTSTTAKILTSPIINDVNNNELVDALKNSLKTIGEDNEQTNKCLLMLVSQLKEIAKKDANGLNFADTTTKYTFLAIQEFIKYAISFFDRHLLVLKDIDSKIEYKKSLYQIFSSTAFEEIFFKLKRLNSQIQSPFNNSNDPAQQTVPDVKKNNFNIKGSYFSALIYKSKGESAVANFADIKNSITSIENLRKDILNDPSLSNKNNKVQISTESQQFSDENLIINWSYDPVKEKMKSNYQAIVFTNNPHKEDVVTTLRKFLNCIEDGINSKNYFDFYKAYLSWLYLPTKDNVKILHSKIADIAPQSSHITDSKDNKLSEEEIFKAINSQLIRLIIAPLVHLDWDYYKESWEAFGQFHLHSKMSAIEVHQHLLSYINQIPFFNRTQEKTEMLNRLSKISPDAWQQDNTDINTSLKINNLISQNNKAVNPLMPIAKIYHLYNIVSMALDELLPKIKKEEYKNVLINMRDELVAMLVELEENYDSLLDDNEFDNIIFQWSKEKLIKLYRAGTNKVTSKLTDSTLLNITNIIPGSLTYVKESVGAESIDSFEPIYIEFNLTTNHAKLNILSNYLSQIETMLVEYINQHKSHLILPADKATPDMLANGASCAKNILKEILSLKFSLNSFVLAEFNRDEFMELKKLLNAEPNLNGANESNYKTFALTTEKMLVMKQQLDELARSGNNLNAKKLAEKLMLKNGCPSNMSAIINKITAIITDYTIMKDPFNSKPINIIIELKLKSILEAIKNNGERILNTAKNNKPLRSNKPDKIMLRC